MAGKKGWGRRKHGRKSDGESYERQEKKGRESMEAIVEKKVHNIGQGRRVGGESMNGRVEAKVMKGRGRRLERA